MVRLGTTLLTLTLVATGALAGASAAAAGVLLDRHQPAFVLDPNELFRPARAAPFVADSTLERQTAPGVWTVVDPAPTFRTLPSADAPACVAAGLEPCFRLNQQPCSPAGGITGARECYAPAAARHGGPAVVYGHRTDRRDRIVLQYWAFWYENAYSYRYPPDDLIWQTHEGDWEAVAVVLDRATRRPLELGVSQHCTGARRPWADATVVPRTGHPVVHVAVGSHAFELGPGVHPIDQRCIPADALAFLEANGLPAPADVAAPGPVLALAGVMPGAEPLVLRTLTRTWPRWADFPGDWGEDQLFHGPPPINTVAFGTSPNGPAQHALWRRPLRTLAGWAER